MKLLNFVTIINTGNDDKVILQFNKSLFTFKAMIWGKWNMFGNYSCSTFKEGCLILYHIENMH